MAVLALAAVCAAGRAAPVALPEMGDASAAVLPAEEAARIGRAFHQRLYRAGRILEDPEVDAWLRHLGGRLAQEAGAGGVHLFVVRDPSLNAFAAPGGYIGIHAGLILAARREDEVAAVLAHEIAHVTQRHLARTLEAMRSLSLPTAVGLLAAVLAGAADPQLGQAAVAGVVAGQAQAQIGFTREHEREADRVGMELLAAAGFDPQAMAGLFETLQQRGRYYTDVLPEFLRTHPVTAARLAEARARARGLVPRPAEESDFAFAQARLRVLTAERPLAAAAHFEPLLEGGQATPAQRAAAHYGLALALRRAGRLEEAGRHVQAALAAAPDRLAVRLERARWLAAAGREAEAGEAFAALAAVFPGNEAVLAAWARFLLERGQARAARDLLVDAVRGAAVPVALRELLARAHMALGERAAAHEQLAEAAAQRGDLGAALEQVALALAADPDRYRKARLEARRARLQAEMAERR